MRQYLFPQTGKFYKVNLHSHSTYSDGTTTPEEIKEAYKARGYAAVAYTEHEGIFDFTHLNDEDFIAITSYEYDWNTCKPLPSSYAPHTSPTHWDFKECMHFNLYARDPHNTKMICHNPKFMHCGNVKNYRDQAQFVGDGNFEQTFTVECFNEVIRTANENGFLVIYNHPLWSMNTYDTYSKLEGLLGMEIINGPSYAPQVYDDMLRTGKRLICVGGDDNHGPGSYGKAWTMIHADELSHEALIGALEKGDCYASFGPEIHDLYVEEGKVYVKTSAAWEIMLSTAGRKVVRKRAPAGETVTEAVLELRPHDEFFRITVTDPSGKCAHTRAYYLDELDEYKA